MKYAAIPAAILILLATILWASINPGIKVPSEPGALRKVTEITGKPVTITTGHVVDLGGGKWMYMAEISVK